MLPKRDWKDPSTHDEEDAIVNTLMHEESDILQRIENVTKTIETLQNRILILNIRKECLRYLREKAQCSCKGGMIGPNMVNTWSDFNAMYDVYEDGQGESK